MARSRTLRKQRRDDTNAVQYVPGTCLLVFTFAAYLGKPAWESALAVSFACAATAVLVLCQRRTERDRRTG